MTKKHLIIIARALKDSKPDKGTIQYKQWETTYFSIVDELEKANPNFNYDVFSKACGR